MRYAFVLFVLFSSCTYNSLTPLPVCESENPSFITCVKPIIDNHCLSCHYASSSSGDLSDYNTVREYVINGDLLDRIQRNQNEEGFMPLGGNKLDQEQIEVLIKWKNNGAPNN